MHTKENNLPDIPPIFFVRCTYYLHWVIHCYSVMFLIRLTKSYLLNINFPDVYSILKHEFRI